MHRSRRRKLAIAKALESHHDSILLILTDSTSALQSVANLATGHPTQSSIECRIKDALQNREAEDTAIAWVRSHIGIPGNERADRTALFHSYLGSITGLATHCHQRRTEGRVKIVGITLACTHEGSWE